MIDLPQIEQKTCEYSILITEYGKLKKASFVPPLWARNAHVQTIVPKFFVKSPQIPFMMKRIDTPDSDFLDLAMHIPAGAKAAAVMFHGLEGSANSHYILHLSRALEEQGIATIVMHFRGCSGEVNRTPRAYHSGETQDALFVLNWIQQTYPELALFGVGFSLGGNMLLKLLSQTPNIALKAAVSVSAPINLAASSQAINLGLSRMYQTHLLKSMKSNLLTKMQHLDMSAYLRIQAEQVKAISTFYEFDEHITSQLHGFKNACDYYQRASAIGDLTSIQVPTLILHAKDDPFMDARVIPSETELGESVAYELSDKGGHVGFIGGRYSKPDLWLPYRITGFIQEHL